MALPTACLNSDAVLATEQGNAAPSAPRKRRRRPWGCLLAVVVVAGVAVWVGVGMWRTRARAMEATRAKAYQISVERVYIQVTRYAETHGVYPAADLAGVDLPLPVDRPTPECVYIAGYTADNAPPTAVLLFCLHPVDDLYTAIRVDSGIARLTLDELAAALMKQAVDAAKDGVTLTVSPPVRWRQAE